ncbi:MAG: MFS transporter [Cyanosarcina radialis HA8281-LM2]|nr:MFS transporter [Cyanosarcina radialis HA8281-LM2]
MYAFFLVWIGQMVSTIGSYMTDFATTIWAWEFTGQATTLALVGFFSQAPGILITPFLGTLVDRTSRKQLMMLSDAIAALSTIALLWLYSTGNLQVWHFYITAAINGTFSQIQHLAYTASIALMVPPQHYTRASSMNSMLHYSSIVFAPALAGSLYYVVGFSGILSIDLITFCVAVLTVWRAIIPQPVTTETKPLNWINLWQETLFGFRYIFTHANLSALLILGSLFWFAHDLGGSLYSAMILARTDNNAAILASLLSTAGIGGVIGASIFSIWGGFKRQIHGFLLGMVGAGLSKTVFALGQQTSIWIPAQFCSSLNFPMLGSSNDAIWMNQVKPEFQGRVFATTSFIGQVTAASATLIAGPLADRIFEPAMMPEGSLTGIFGSIFGTGAGAGMALLYATTSLCLLFIGIGGYIYFYAKLMGKQTS